MQQSNISHNSISFSGILQPLIELLGRTRTEVGKMTGQELIMSSKSARAIAAIDSDKNIHLLLYPTPKTNDRFSKLEFNGLKIEVREWSVVGFPQMDYLDLACQTGKSPSFQRPFLRLAEDVLYEMERSDSEPEEAVYRTCLRWQRFWNEDMTQEFTREWLHGIFGELTLLENLINRFGSGVVDCWAGPSGADHDFQKERDLAVEVKTSTEVPFKIHCNIRQLDSSLFKKLFIICYKLTLSEAGTKLSELVRRVEHALEHDEEYTEKFYQKLAVAGYQRQLEAKYDEYVILVDEGTVFKVDEKFPRIIESSFTEAPDHRITNIRYTLQLVGLPELSVEDISEELNLFKHDLA